MALFLIILAASLPGQAAFGLGLEDVELDGKIRFRWFQFAGNANIPGQINGEGGKQINYADLFLRNNIKFNIYDHMSIYTRFDIFAVMGENDGAFGSSDLGFNVRQAYLSMILPTVRVGIEAGFQSFSIGHGLFLANSGAGVKIKYDLDDNKSNAYLYYIIMYDHSRTNVNGNIGLAEYSDSQIVSLGSKWNPFSFLLLDFSITGQYHLENLTTQHNLLWFGASAKVPVQNFTLLAEGAYNFGNIISPGSLVEIQSFATLFKLEYLFDLKRASLPVRLIGSITSGDLQNPQSGSHFRTIGYGHGIANLGVDNGGGLSMFRNGSGLYIYGGEVQFDTGILSLLLRGAHFISYADALSAGAEVDLIMKTSFTESISFDVNSGLFFPDIGYPDYRVGVENQLMFELYLSFEVKY